MRVIGGEIEVCFKNSIYYTDSGRSSLKVFFQNFKGKILLPDFLCEVIVSVLEEENIEYEFYHIKEDLSIDFESVKSKIFDIFYFINYFGIIQKIDYNLDDKFVIEDNVFLYDFENRYNFKKWFGFNSYRKVTNLADGSLIKTNLNIKIEYKENMFSNLKYKAKQLKYDYIINNYANEEEYLKYFNKAETILDSKQKIGRISNKSIYLLANYENDNIQNVRKKRFNKLLILLKDKCINKNPIYYSFFVIKIDNRDSFRKKLFEKNIYLPVHWPQPNSLNNHLYDEIISIPLFENYSDEEFDYLYNNIRNTL